MSNKTIFQEKNTRLSANNTDLASILNTINNLPSSSGGEVVAENIFSNDYSQIGYTGNYIKTTGYTTTGVLWSDLTKYTGQSDTWCVTNPIEIKPDTWYKYEGFSSGNNPACCFLGSDKTTIYEGFIYKGAGTFYTPEEAKYIVMSVAKANIGTMSVKKMTEAEIKASETEAIIKRTITRYSNDNLTSVGSYAFHSCTSLAYVNLPKATSLGTSAFNNCTALSSIEIPLVSSINIQTFYACNSLTSLTMPSLKTIGSQGVRANKKLAKVDLGVVTSIGALSFDGCSLLDTCIIRTSSVCTLVNVSAFTGTPIASGTGYIYVPDDLLASYRTATNWSTYAEQIVPLSTYSEDEIEK